MLKYGKIFKKNNIKYNSSIPNVLNLPCFSQVKTLKFVGALRDSSINQLMKLKNLELYGCHILTNILLKKVEKLTLNSCKFHESTSVSLRIPAVKV